MNKKISFLLFFAIIFIGCSEKNNVEVIVDKSNGITEGGIPSIQGLNIIKYVNAPEGLRVRKSPGINADRIGVLDNATKVIVIKEDEHDVTIDGINGKWTLVESEYIQGWVFGGFLSFEPADSYSSNNTMADIQKYFVTYLNLNNIKGKNNIDDFIKAFGVIGERRTVDRKEYEVTIHGSTGTMVEYTIKSNPYTIVALTDDFLLSSLEIEVLHIDDFLYLFPHRTKEGFIADNNFGKIYRIRDDSVMYGCYWHEELKEYCEDYWYLIFRDGFLHKLRLTIQLWD